MAYPSDSDFSLYDGSLITNVQWDSNFQKIPILWSSGSYDINVNQITAGTYVGLPSDNFTGTTGESIDAGDIVRLSGGLLYKATNATSAGVTGVVGVSTTTTASGLTATVASDYYSSFSSLTVGATYYVGVNGAKVTTEPSEYPVVLGTAVSATRLNINIQEDRTPAGTIMAYSVSEKPNGTIIAAGDDVSRTAHARLFGVYGTTYGEGDGSTTFGTPDFEGEFLRGLDSTRTIGDTQADATAVNALATVESGLHHHKMFQDVIPSSNVIEKPATYEFVPWQKSFTGGDDDYNYAMTGNGDTTPAAIGRNSQEGAHTHSLTGDTETRPANKAVLYCIKL
jgi:microcystin-dependent protein